MNVYDKALVVIKRNSRLSDKALEVGRYFHSIDQRALIDNDETDLEVYEYQLERGVR